MATASVRVHIGGLAPDVTAQELQERFGRVAASAQCQLAHVELPRSRLTPSQSRGFAYVTIVGAAAERALEDITKAYHKTKWRGGVLRVAPAAPDYQARLQSEWDARDALQQARDAAVEAERRRMLPAAEDVAELRTETPFEGKRKTVFNEDDGEDDVVMEEAGEAPAEEEEWTEEAIQALIAEKLAEEATDTESDSMEDDEEKERDEEEEEDEQSGAESDASSVASDGPSSTPAQHVLSVEEANARRLAALEEKKKKQDASSKGFLGKIDVVGAASGKKITFDDDGEVAEIEDGRDAADKLDDDPQDAPAKRAAIVDWMGSDDDEDNEPANPDGYGELDDEKLLRQGGAATKKSLKTLEFDDGEEIDAQEDTDDQARFALRPEFLGETGKKLFEMQKRFGGDQRFRMDARFIEEDENEYFAHDGDDMDMLAPVLDDLDGEEEFLQNFQTEEDADRLALYAEEMVHERDQALDVIAELFPDVDVDKIKARLEALKNKDPIKEASWMGEQMRYDPRVAATTKYELTDESQSRRAAKDEDEKVAEEERRLAEEKRKREEKEVLIGGDRFYSASTTLGSLFSRVRKNSEDGEVGEAALDGVFSFSKPADTKVENESATEAAPSAFKLSSLFDFSFGGDNEKKNELAMGEDLLEAEDDEDTADGVKMPWHFTQSFNDNGGTGDDQRVHVAEDDGTDKEDDDADQEDAEENDDDVHKKKQKRVRVKRSLDDFLAFGRTFFGGTTLSSLTTKEAKDAWQAQWAERRKKLTQDFKRKRRDALKQKKKQQQALQRHNAKRQKTAAK